MIYREYVDHSVAGAAPTPLGNIQNFASAMSELRATDVSLDRMIQIQEYGPRQIIALPQQLMETMYVVMKGTVHLVCSSDSRRRLIVASLEPGSIFGQGPLEEPAISNVVAEAADTVTVWSLPAEKARSLVVQYPILTWALLQTYGRRLAQVEDNLEDIAYRKLPERLANLIWDLADEEGIVEGLSHQALADHLGTYRETVSAVLRDFKQAQILSLGYRRIVVLDREALADVGGVWAE